MKTRAALEAAWTAQPPSPREGRISGLIVRLGGGEHARPQQITVTAEGVEGDRWASGKRDLRAQVSVMEARVAALVADGGDVSGVGDNLLVDLDLSAAHLPPGSRLRVGGALLEVSDKPHLGCHKFTARFGTGAMRWVNEEAHRGRRLRGLLTRVIEGGVVRVGDSIRRV